MNVPKPRFLVGIVIALSIAWVVLALLVPQFVQAGGVVTDCSNQGSTAALNAALANGGTVTFNCPQGPYNIYFNFPKTISLNTTIDGANGGHTISFVSVDSTRILSVTQGVALTLKNLNLYGGFDTNGGCIYTNGALTLNNVHVENCMAGSFTSGGAIYVSNTGSANITNSQILSNTAYYSGGAIYNLGTLNVSGSYLAYNRLPDLSKQSSSTYDGGGIWTLGTATIDNTTIYSNTASNGYGGGIYNQGTLNVTNSEISTNRVQKGGGGIQNYLGTTTVQNTNVLSNTVSEYKSTNGGGGLMNSQGTLNVSNSTVSSNRGNFAGGGIRNDGMATLSNVTIQNNDAEYGGGIRSTGTLNYTGGTVNGNSAYQTGGIYILGNNSQTTLTNLTVSGNYGQANGGGIQSGGTTNMSNLIVTGNTASGGYGGGISGGTSLVNSTVSGNTAYNGGGVSGVSYIANSTISRNRAKNDGGGLWLGSTNIVNSTISGNKADDYGGGIYVTGSTTNLYNVTVTDNTANWDGDMTGFGGGVSNAGTFNFINTIIGPNYFVNGNILDVDDCYGVLNSLGYNIVNNSTCGFSGIAPTIADPLLGALQNNGGTTNTHALNANSPAINAGNPNGCKDNNNTNLTTDQRGFVRPINTNCDIGAYEYNPNPPTFTPTPSNTPTRTPTSTRTPTPTATPTPCAVKPLAPTLLAPANNSKTSKSRVQLDWDDTACATKYKVIVKAGSKSGTKADGKTLSPSQYKTISLPLGEYYWRVNACNAIGCTASAWSHFTRK